jgi:hypothetical protein
MASDGMADWWSTDYNLYGGGGRVGKGVGVGAYGESILVVGVEILGNFQIKTII